MGQVVINTRSGGFVLSAFALDMLEQRGYTVEHTNYGSWVNPEIERHNEDLIDIVMILGDDASGRYSSLDVKTFEGNVYRIEESESGIETVITPDTEKWIVIEEGE